MFTLPQQPLRCFVFRLVASLPKLAWLALVSRRFPAEVIVLHGEAVETQQAFFCEGVWDGSFAVGKFAETCNFFGSGATLEAGGITFSATCALVDSLYYAEHDSRLWVSNSLPCLLAATGDRLSPREAGYPALLDSGKQGLRGYAREIVTERAKVNRLAFANLRVSSDGIDVVEKPLPPRFARYSDYRAYLEESYGSIAKNARDPARRNPLSIVSTQSRGYDTTAVNAIASVFGLDQVFTVPRARDKQSYVVAEREDQGDDDGTEICRALKVPCVHIDRLSYRNSEDAERLFYAGHYKAADVNLRDIGRHIVRPSLLLTGIAGDMWEAKPREKDLSHFETGTFGMTDMGGHGITEYRLHVGLIHLPFPFMGARSRDDIHEIARSKEMDPWRLGVAYDRPIARRIAEERGVPRGMFGQRKMNTTVAFPMPPLPRSAEIRRRYLSSLVASGAAPRWKTWFFPLMQRVNQVVYYHTPTRYRFVYLLERAISFLRGERGWTARFEFGSAGKRYFGGLYCFHVNEIAEKSYHAALREELVRL